MAKVRTQFVCQQCGRKSARDLGRCPQCGAWNSMVEEIVAPTPSKVSSAGRGLGGVSSPRRLSEITGDVEERMPLAMGEFARVLGGGLVPGSVVLIEWADKIQKALSGTNFIRIELDHLAPNRRSIRISNAPDYLRL